MALLDYKPQGKGTLGSYVRFAPGEIDHAVDAPGLGVITYYGTRRRGEYVDITADNMKAIELVPGMEAEQDNGKAQTLSRMPKDFSQEQREVTWYALLGGRRARH